MNNQSDNNQETMFSAISNLAGELFAASLLFILIIPILFAPILGYYIRGNLMATYNLSENDEVIKSKMLPVWIFLWIVAIIGWSVILYLQCVAIAKYSV